MSNRQKLVAGNWKMNESRDGAVALAREVCDGISNTQAEVLLCPASVHLSDVSRAIADCPQVKLGAQDVSTHDNGAFTGEISCEMLSDLDCDYVIVGHSERRQYHGETSELVAEKAHKALASGLIPVICVGETLEQREADETQTIIEQQVRAAIHQLGIDAFEKAVIAYEPVWAIGTGKTASPEQAQAVHAYIRSILAGENADVSEKTRILYGGSVKPDNAKTLFGQPDIDGGLIGGAALKASDFLAIVNATDS